ncbi:MAG TPA: hypothetical protein VKF62_08030 [Planctomycetota bacterium]|nr:hypothetical protein [Planctomycetota bacterium]
MIAALCLFPFLALASRPLSQESPPGVRVEKSPKGDVVVVDPGLTLGGLVQRGGEILGRVYLSRTQDSTGLSGTPVGLSASQTVPLADFEPWLEGVLRTHDFATVIPPEGTREPFQLVHLRGEGRNTLVTSARLVPVEDLASFRHPGTVIRTSLPLRYIDAARAATNLRPLFTEPNLESVSMAGNSNTLVLQGFPRTVSTWVEVLKLADVEPVGRPEEVAAIAERLRAPARVEESVEGRLKRVEEALDALRAAVRDLAADLRR